MSRQRPRLLDLFCGAGGAAVGYHRAGFDVVGVDIKPQPHYPFEFHQADAIEVLRREAAFGHGWTAAAFDAIHASPPCQFGTAYRRRPGHVRDSPNLIPQTRELLKATGLPYVIENNWVNRRHLVDPIRLCGSTFGLDVQRHRAFESNVPLLPPPCDHGWQTARFPQATNRTNLRRTVEVGVWRIPLADQRRAMGIDWMDLEELSEAVPPAYTEWIGRQLLALGLTVAPAWLGGHRVSASRRCICGHANATHGRIGDCAEDPCLCHRYEPAAADGDRLVFGESRIPIRDADSAPAWDPAAVQKWADRRLRQ